MLPLNWPFWWPILAVVYARRRRREVPLLKTYTTCCTAWNLQRLMPWQKPLHSKSCPCTRKHFLVLWHTSSDMSTTCCLIRLFSGSAHGIHWWWSPRLCTSTDPESLTPVELDEYWLVWGVTGNQFLAYVTQCDKSSLSRWASWLGQFDPHWRVKLRF